MEPFEVATVVLSKETNVSLSTVFPIVYGLKKKAINEDDSPAVRQFKANLVSALSRRWHLDSFTPSNISILATALDPRFRQLCFLTEEQRDLIQAELLLRNNEDESTEPPSPKKNKTAFDLLLGEEDDVCTSFKTELSQFITEKPIPRDSDALEWWKMNTSRFPRLAEIARRLLCVPASSTASQTFV